MASQVLATQKFSVSAAGRVHILDGDLKGSGGHRFGAGKNKNEFPQSWSDDEIIQAIEEVANDPTSAERQQSGGRVRRAGVRNGMLIVVVVDLGTGEIMTGFPRRF
jgi:EndoU nuclease-like protein